MNIIFRFFGAKVVVKSFARKIYSFGQPSMEALLDPFLTPEEAISSPPFGQLSLDEETLRNDEFHESNFFLVGFFRFCSHRQFGLGQLLIEKELVKGVSTARDVNNFDEEAVVNNVEAVVNNVEIEAVVNNVEIEAVEEESVEEESVQESNDPMEEMKEDLKKIRCDMVRVMDLVEKMDRVGKDAANEKKKMTLAEKTSLLASLISVDSARFL